MARSYNSGTARCRPATLARSDFLSAGIGVEGWLPIGQGKKNLAGDGIFQTCARGKLRKLAFGRGQCGKLGAK